MAGKTDTITAEAEAPEADATQESIKRGVEQAESGDLISETEAQHVKVKGRSQVKYFGQEGFVGAVLDELPEQAKAERTYGASTLYHDMLVAVAEDEANLGKWHKIADFGTVQGAGGIATNLNKQVAGNIGEGKGQLRPNEVRNLPTYEGWHFEFAGVKVPKPEGAEGERVSQLYARLVEDVAVEAEAEVEG